MRDNGIGIPAERCRTFSTCSPSSTAAPTSRRAASASAWRSVRRLIEMHGGTVSAHSEGAGRGSEFEIRLPVHRGEARRQAAREAAASSAAAPIVPRRILIADDNADALASLTEVLRLYGHEVFSAPNGRAALECAERHLPEVALLDIGMPQLDGYEVARRIRAQAWGKQVTLLALTGWGQDSDRRRSAEAGFDLHLVKPVDVVKLTELLAQLPASASSEAPYPVE